MPQPLIDRLPYLYDIEQFNSSCRLRDRAYWADAFDGERLQHLTCLQFTTNVIEK